jgi:NADH dehydrogenase FAD-containing subunit/uncharacterized membrane protein YphA (DoxX/SURF4 family)
MSLGTMEKFASVATLARLRNSLWLWFAGYRTYKRIFHPFVDLGIRFCLSSAFFHSGATKVFNWQHAMYLSHFEYPVTWMSPERATLVVVIVELFCPVLLLLGLFTRLAALPMAMLAIVIQVRYVVLDTNLFWVAILSTYVVFGAGGLSLDALIAPGLADSPLPIVPRLVRIAERLSKLVGPVFQILLRLWLGWALMRLPSLTGVFPESSVQSFLPQTASILGGLMLTLGLGATVVNKVFAATIVGSQMMNASDTTGFWMILLMARFGIIGAGPFSFDNYLYNRLTEWMKPNHGRLGADDWRRVVVVGGGFGGMACAMKLRHLPVHLTIIDRQNYHLFQPLLYQVATAGLAPADIASPIRSEFRDDPNVRVVMDTVTGIDLDQQKVRMLDRELPFDLLVIATGASHSYFGHDDWAGFAPGLKRIDDATMIRAKLLSAFERAENAIDAAERDACLTFVVVGGGPTGVELAGAIAELARFGLEEEFRNIEPATARIVIVESGSRVLSSFPEQLSLHARKSLEKLGVEVRVDSQVREIDSDGVTIGEQKLRARTVLWAAGVVASPAAGWLKVEVDRSGRIRVDQYLRVTGLTNVFAIGDTAFSLGWNGRQVPGLAPAAKQGGQYVASVIRSQLEKRGLPAAFAYRHQGSLATIGRSSAVADFGRVRMWGAPAWWLWGTVHVLFLSGMRNRLSVVIAWVWAYLTFRSGSRLITGRSFLENKSAPY